MSDRPAGLTAREWGAWVAPLPDKRKPVDPNANKCVFCGRYHGGVNTQLNCLERGIQALRTAIVERDAELRSLKNVQRRSIVLPGWHCQMCHAFNGEEKERLAQCRACGGPDDESTSTPT